jgi:hypothetical protein
MLLMAPTRRRHQPDDAIKLTPSVMLRQCCANASTDGNGAEVCDLRKGAGLADLKKTAYEAQFDRHLLDLPCQVRLAHE